MPEQDKYFYGLEMVDPSPGLWALEVLFLFTHPRYNNNTKWAMFFSRKNNDIKSEINSFFKKHNKHLNIYEQLVYWTKYLCKIECSLDSKQPINPFTFKVKNKFQVEIPYTNNNSS